jgi:hypothetical protein
VINCDCPRCGSRNTKSLSVLYGDGTRKSTSRKDGLFYYRRSIGLHTSTTRGQSQTLSAANSAPPSSSIGTTAMLLIVVGAVVAGAAWYWIGFWIIVLLAVAGSDAKDEEHRLREWQATFRCGRCGTVFAVVEAVPERIAVTHDQGGGQLLEPEVSHPLHVARQRP